MIRSTYDVLATADSVAVFGLLVLLCFGHFGRFWFLGAYAAWEFSGSLGLTIFDLRRTASQHLLYSHCYWTFEVTADLLLFLVFIILTHQAAPLGPIRNKIDKVLSIAAGVVIALPLITLHPVFKPWPSAQWFNSTGEILNFGAAIMNLLLWGALIALRHRDPQLLKVSAGLGIRVTGMATSYGVRHFFPSGVSLFVPNLFLILAQLAGSLVLCWAFWPARKPQQAIPAASTVST